MQACEIRRGPVWATFSGPDEARRLLQTALTLDAPGAMYTPAFRRGQWDGKVRFYTRATDRFLAGLSDRVSTLLSAQGFAPTIQWTPSTWPSERLSWAPPPNGLTWHPHQTHAIESAPRRGGVTYQSPTGSGKTEIGLEILRRVGLPALWVVNSRSLLDQTLARVALRLPTIDVGTAVAGVIRPGLLTIALVQTLQRLAPDDQFWSRWGVVVFDEAHHASAETSMRIAEYCARAELRIGLSGTAIHKNDPVRNLKLEGITGPIVVVAETLELASRGFLATPHVVLLTPPSDTYPSYPDVRQAVCPTWRANPRQLATMGNQLYRESYQRGITDNVARSRLLINAARWHATRGEKVLMLCLRRTHAKALLGLFAQGTSAIPAWSLDGTAPAEDRESVLQAFKTHAGGAMLFTTPFFREGMDAPEIDVLILAGGGESEIALLQSAGRGLRTRPDKSEVLIYDVIDGYDPTDDKDYLAQHTQARLATYTAQRWRVTWTSKETVWRSFHSSASSRTPRSESTLPSGPYAPVSEAP